MALLQSLGGEPGLCGFTNVLNVCGGNFQKCEAGGFFISRLCPCPVAQLVKSGQFGRKVGLCRVMSVVTRLCQCVRCIF